MILKLSTMEKRSYEELKTENDLLLKEIQKIKSLKTNSERYWILAARAIAFVIGFLPFIPNTLYYIGMADEKHPIGTSDIFFVAIGFVMLWGSGNFGNWANELGKKITGKYK
jgi:hypothetical protein